MQIKTCPTCGSRRIKQVTEDVPCDFGGHAYISKDITFYSCPAYGERVYGREAMRRMEAQRPQMHRTLGKKTA